MKIHIFYSHYEVTGTDYKYRPNWFDYEKCFVNLLNTIEGKNNVSLHVMMDGKIENNWIKKYKDKYIGHEFIGGSMERAAMEIYKTCYEYSNNMEDTDLFYFLENDYLHVDGWVDKVTDLFSTYSGLHYVSLYDHGDKYFHPNYDDLVSKLFVSNTHHWRTMMSTCGSFVVSKKLWKEDYDFHTSIVGDHNKWLAIAEQRERFLLSAVPGLSTHCMEGLLSPTIDWKKINN